MKTLFLLCLLSFTAFASNWVPVSKIESQSAQAYQLQSECQKSGEQCLDVGDEPEVVSKGFASIEDDWSAKTQVESCEGQEACQSALEALVCEVGQAFIKGDFTEVYCSANLGKKLVVNSAGFASYKAQETAKAQYAAALAQAKKLRECGTQVLDLVLVRNAGKTLNTTQVKAMVGIYAPIKGLLETGSLNSAKEEVQAIEPDGTLVTVGDKAAVVSAIDSCIGG